MSEFLSDQQTINGMLLIIGLYICIGITKLSIVQDAMKDEIDDIFKRKK